MPSHPLHRPSIPIICSKTIVVKLLLHFSHAYLLLYQPSYSNRSPSNTRSTLTPNLIFTPFYLSPQSIPHLPHIYTTTTPFTHIPPLHLPTRPQYKNPASFSLHLSTKPQFLPHLILPHPKPHHRIQHLLLPPSPRPPTNQPSSNHTLPFHVPINLSPNSTPTHSFFSLFSPRHFTDIQLR